MFALMQVAFPPAYIFSLTIVLIIAAAVTLIRIKWLQTVICSLFIGFQLATTIANVIANATCMEIFSLETLKTLGMAFGNAGAIELGYWFLVPIIALLLVYIVAVVLIIWFFRAPCPRERGYWQAMFCGVLAFVSFFCYTTAYACSPNYQRGSSSYVANLSNQKFLYDTFSNRVSSLHMFGSYSYYLDNLLSLMGGKTAMTDVMQLEVEDFQANDFALDEDEVLGEGYNLIMVLMETFERAAINPVTMPNLYNFMLESCVEVDGYYSIERTCFTDYIGQTGMHVAGKELWNNYGNVTVPHSLANIFGQSGYQTAAFHNFKGSSYNRAEIFTKRLGFDEFNDFTDYQIPLDAKQQYTAHCGLNSDELLFKNNLEKIAPTDKNFYSYVIGVSTHSTNASWYNLGDYYPQYFEHIEKPENWEKLTAMYPVLKNGTAREILTAKNYLAGTYSFDLGFGALLERLQTTRGKDGRLLIETTALVLFGDHYYYVNPHALKAENDDPRGLVGNRCPMIVYNPRAKVRDLDGNKHNTTQAENAVANGTFESNPNNRIQSGRTIYRFTSTMDLYPTICSLFGIQTDRQLTYGHSIFDESEPSIGVAYLGGYTWGATDYTVEPDTINETYAPNTTWHIWRTLDFVHFTGVTLTAAQIEAVTPLVNRTYASIFLDTSLFNRNGFQWLNKYATEGAYRLGKSN